MTQDSPGVDEPERTRSVEEATPPADDPTLSIEEPMAPVDGPTESIDDRMMSFASGEPTVAGPTVIKPTADATMTSPTAIDPTVINPTVINPTAADPTMTSPTAIGPTMANPTMAGPIAADSTVGGQTVPTWSLDALLQEPPPVWRAEPETSLGDAGSRGARSPAYYASLTVAVILALGLVAALTVLSVNPPTTRVAGDATGVPIPELPPPTDSTPPVTSTPSTPPAADDPVGELAAHPLSTSTAAAAELTCALPRFDPADDAQARFYDAAKVCADGAFGGLVTSAGLPTVPVRVVTVQGGPDDSPCGAVEPTAPATTCRGTVYMTPARLRDVEALDRYPGKYLGVFLREYAEAVLDGSGVTELYEDAKAAPDSPTDLDDRLAGQSTCLAGIASGAMAGRGAVDTNITNEIRERLTSVDAPPDAAAWLDKGFRSRQPASCNTWT